MSSPIEKKGKGKVPARDYPQNKRLPAMGQSFEEHEGASSTSHRGATSLQTMYPEMDTYSSLVSQPIPHSILCLLYPFITDNEGITAHPFSQFVKFEFVRSPVSWEIKSLQKASISKTLSTLTAYNQAQNLDSVIANSISLQSQVWPGQL